MEYFTWNIDINFIRVIKTSIQGSVYGYSGSYTKEIYDRAKIPATPQESKNSWSFQNIFHMDSSQWWEYYNSQQAFHSLYEHTKSLCGILPLGLAHPLLPKNTYMVFLSPQLGRVELHSLNHVISDILEESLVQSISLCVITFLGVSTKQANVKTS